MSRSKERKKIYKEQWRMRNPEKLKAQALRTRYGIAIEKFNEMMLVQRGRCAICKLHSLDVYNGLHIDHDHETGHVRGLLCSKCNKGIGLFNEDVKIIQKAMDYLNAFTPKKNTL